MPISKEEIKKRAAVFIKEWATETNEDAEAKSFWDDFFLIFDVKRRRLASFEHYVKKLNDKQGFIDLFWPGKLIVEHKSRGKNLDKAYDQVMDYFPGIPDKELPKYILVSDFNKFRLYDIENNNSVEFELHELLNYIDQFEFIAGYEKRIYKEQDPVNIKAALLMGDLHDQLKAEGYEGHDLEVYLVRLLFCLFADDTSIFDKGMFDDYLDLNTKEDGSDLAAHLAQLFDVLNTPIEKRLKHNEALNAFPYINGRLFEEPLSFAGFNSDTRKILLDCCKLDWSKISPAIFGSLFQSVMNPKERRNIGAHYTSEKNILKVIKPLFLDELWKELNTARNDKNRLRKLHDKIRNLTFLDPACGCGNFLIISYRELRKLELELVHALLKNQQVTSINDYFLVDVDQFYGIEYEEFPSQIAQVAMWLIDHQMNEEAGLSFGEYYKRIPLTKSATIIHGNALQMDWQSLIDNKENEFNKQESEFFLKEKIPASPETEVTAKPSKKFDFILGNPPFIGKHLQSSTQKKDMEQVFSDVYGAGVLDYVTAWYIKAAKYITDVSDKKQTRCAFVSTNSIAQGEQVGVLWNELFNKYKIKIHFAHRTFKWGNEAKGNAAVHVVVIGFSNYDISEKPIYEYEDIKSEPHEIIVKNINPYLVEGKDFVINTRKKPICNIPEMLKGSQPTDNGNLLLSDIEREKFLKTEPQAEKLIKPFISAKEFLNAENRWCFWLIDINPLDLKACPSLLERIKNVQNFRLKSTKAATVKWAQMPTLFTENRQPKNDYILIPRHSSENRKYIPFGVFTKEYIVADSCNSIPNASKYHFGVLSSLMHMVWIKHVCGRLESRYRYSNDIVYNNFPWPEKLNEKKEKLVEDAVKLLLETRALFSNNSLADLYDPLTMPPILVKAHEQLDRAVDLCYRSQPFISEAKRIEFLFELYEKYTAGLFAKENENKKPPSKSRAT